MMRYVAGIVLMLAASIAWPALADDYPNKPIKVISDSAPGSTVNVTVHMVMDRVGGAAVTEQDKAFFRALKDAIIAHRVAWIAARVSYPLFVKIGGKRRPIKNRREFVAHFKKIIDQNVSTAVINQDPEKMFRNWRGVMIGNGEI